MPRRPPSKPYSGHLAKRIRPRTQEELESLLDAQLGRLFDHHEIPDGPDMWRELALELAFEHVLGFQLAEPLGAHPYPPDDDITIFQTLHDAKKGGKSIAQAAHDLADWGAAEGKLSGLSANSIRERYYRLLRNPNAINRMLAHDDAKRKRLERRMTDLEAVIVHSGLKIVEGKHYRATVSNDGGVRVEKLC